MKFINYLLAGVLGASLTPLPASANLFDGCTSDQILERFVEFGKTGKMPLELGHWLNNPEAQYVEPWKPFDNVDYVGICWVSAWLIHTDDGVVLIDTLYGPFTQQLLDNIEKVGVELTDIKYVFMTHGHFDHAGGAATLKSKLPNAKFAMTQTGWDEAMRSAKASEGSRREWKMISPELVVNDGDSIDIGGNTFQVLETPGHTWGTASYAYDVIDGNDTYRSVTIGGLGLNAIEGPSQVEAYIKSVDKVRSLVENQNSAIEVHLTTHGFSNNLEENRLILQSRKDGDTNVFVDSKALLNQIESLRARAVARLEKESNK